MRQVDDRIPPITTVARERSTFAPVSEGTSIHWHGQRLPNGMGGVTGLTQPVIPAGKASAYEYVAQRTGTFMYHPHADEMVQMAMGIGYDGHLRPADYKFSVK